MIDKKNRRSDRRKNKQSINQKTFTGNNFHYSDVCFSPFNERFNFHSYDYVDIYGYDVAYDKL